MLCSTVVTYMHVLHVMYSDKIASTIQPIDQNTDGSIVLLKSSHACTVKLIGSSCILIISYSCADNRF